MVHPGQLKDKMLYSLELYKEQESRLNSLMMKKPDRIVSSNEWRKLTEQFKYIHEKDAELNSLVDIEHRERLLPDIQGVAEELRNCIIRVKQGLDTLYMRISGEHKLVDGRLKRIARGRKIGGYKSGFVYRRGPEQSKTEV